MLVELWQLEFRVSFGFEQQLNILLVSVFVLNVHYLV